MLAIGATCMTGAPAVFAQDDPARFARVHGALVLSGGGARGAYEAGWIEGLRRAGSVPDGVPLPGIDVVCGSSIGSINAWYVATAQYSQLAQVWRGIGQANIFRLKRRYAATANPHAFLLTKIIQSLSLARGLTTNVQGILDGPAIAQWIDTNLDLRTPLVMPLIFTTTNLDRQRPELFYRLPPGLPSAPPGVILARVREAVGEDVPVRFADDVLFGPAIRASTAIPVLFDPVTLRSREDTLDRYVDGGISDDSPIDIGRALAVNVYLLLCDPATAKRERYANALEIAVGAFGVAQQRIFDASLRATVAAIKEKRLFEQSLPADVRRRTVADVLDTNIFLGRPEHELAVQIAELDRQEKIDAAYALGVADAANGWQQYHF